MRDFMRRYRTESYLKRHPMEKLIGKYHMIHEASEALSPTRILDSTDSEVLLFARVSRTRGFAEMRFKVSDSEPYKLLAFTIKPDVDPLEAEGESTPLDNQIINVTIASVAEILRESYVYPEKGKTMADTLNRYKSERRYAGITEGRVFALKITEDLYALSRDRHLGIRHGSPPAERSALPVEPSPAGGGTGRQIDWPDTPAGRKAKAYFGVDDTGDVLRQFVKKHFSEAVFKEQSLDAVFEFHSRMRSQAGKVNVHSVSADGDFAVEVSLKTEKSGWARLRIEVSPEPPYGLTTFEDVASGVKPTVEDIRNNFGFRKVEVLPNNIGYIRFDQFHNSEEAREPAAAALAFVANCDALIFDLRHNGGGTRHMNQFISSYLFDKAIHLGGQYSRLTDDITEWWTFDTIPGKRFGPDVRVYILTSSNTFSAAEAFAHWLQDLKRATIVGETTGGGAHPVHERAINNRFWMRIPFARAISPVSKTDWEGVGVIPDIEVPASQALDAAICDAIERIRAD
jgi:hypothetical protein